MLGVGMEGGGGEREVREEDREGGKVEGRRIMRGKDRREEDRKGRTEGIKIVKGEGYEGRRIMRGEEQ